MMSEIICSVFLTKVSKSKHLKRFALTPEIQPSKSLNVAAKNVHFLKMWVFGLIMTFESPYLMTSVRSLSIANMLRISTADQEEVRNHETV